jgi:Peptidase family M28
VRVKSFSFILFWLLFLNNPAAASDPARQQEKEPVKILEKNIVNVVQELQSFGNRMTWEKQNEVADYLFNRLRKNKGLDVYFHQYEEGDKTWKNVVARVPGKKDPQTTYIVCAHYDSHPAGLESSGFAPGADDNGTGVAVLLEGARILAEKPGNKTIEWVFFSNEEQGHKGSKAYVRDLMAKGHSIKGIINIDTIGYTQPSLTALWQESQGKNLSGKLVYMAKQLLKKPVYYLQTGFKNPNEILLVGGRPANASLVDKIFSQLKGGDVGIKKNIGPQCG